MDMTKNALSGETSGSAMLLASCIQVSYVKSKMGKNCASVRHDMSLRKSLTKHQNDSHQFLLMCIEILNAYKMRFEIVI